MILPLRNGMTIVSHRRGFACVDITIVRSEDIPTDNPAHAAVRTWLKRARAKRRGIERGLPWVLRIPHPRR